MPTSVIRKKEEDKMEKLIKKVKKNLSYIRNKTVVPSSDTTDSETPRTHSYDIPNKSRKRKLEDMIYTTKHCEENNLHTTKRICLDSSSSNNSENIEKEVLSKSKKRRLKKKRSLNKRLQRLLSVKSKHKQSVQPLNSEGDSDCSSTKEILDQEDEVYTRTSKIEKCITKLFNKSKKSKNVEKCNEMKMKKKDSSNTNGYDNYSSQSSLPCIALDCEMVGVGPGKKSALGRCSIVSSDGSVIYDSYVKPEQTITDFRTRWSGIRRYHMTKAVPFKKAQKTVRNILKDKIVVGHAVHNDFKVLGIKHPKELVRDTSKCQTLKDMANQYTRQAVSLKNLSYALLGKKIQNGSHCSVEDARATMDLYQMVKDNWENKNSKLIQVNDSISDCYLDDDYWPQDVCDH